MAFVKEKPEKNEEKKPQSQKKRRQKRYQNHMNGRRADCDHDGSEDSDCKENVLRQCRRHDHLLSLQQKLFPTDTLVPASDIDAFKDWCLAQLPTTTALQEVMLHVKNTKEEVDSDGAKAKPFLFGQLNVVLQEVMPAGDARAQFVAAYFASLAVASVVECTARFPRTYDLDPAVTFLTMCLQLEAVAPLVRLELPFATCRSLYNFTTGLMFQTSSRCLRPFLEALNDAELARYMFDEFLWLLQVEVCWDTLSEPEECSNCWHEPTALDVVSLMCIENRDKVDFAWGRQFSEVLDKSLPEDCSGRYIGAQVSLVVSVVVQTGGGLCDETSFENLVRVINRLAPDMRVACIARMAVSLTSKITLCRKTSEGLWPD